MFPASRRDHTRTFRRVAWKQERGIHLRTGVLRDGKRGQKGSAAILLSQLVAKAARDEIRRVRGTWDLQWVTGSLVTSGGFVSKGVDDCRVDEWQDVQIDQQRYKNVAQSTVTTTGHATKTSSIVYTKSKKTGRMGVDASIKCSGVPASQVEAARVCSASSAGGS